MDNFEKVIDAMFTICLYGLLFCVSAFFVSIVVAGVIERFLL